MPIWLLLIIITVAVGFLVTLIVNQVPDPYLAPIFKKVLLWGSVIGLIIMWFWFLFTSMGVTDWHLRH